MSALMIQESIEFQPTEVIDRVTYSINDATAELRQLNLEVVLISWLVLNIIARSCPSSRFNPF
jgi:hypothetical protein